MSGRKDEIGELRNNFNVMSEQLEQAISELKSANVELQKDIDKKTQIDEMRREFLSNVTHELKTPIALIQGYAEGLKDNINDDEESREFYCDVIIDEAAKMNEMVKKLLNLNQLEFGEDQVNMERFDLNAVIKGVLQSSDILIRQKEAKVLFTGGDPLYVWGDEFKVEEVITNYLTNALNHLDYDHTIEITCKKEGNVVKTTVFNTGDPTPGGGSRQGMGEILQGGQSENKGIRRKRHRPFHRKSHYGFLPAAVRLPELRQRCGILVHTGGRWKNGRSMIAKSVPEKGNTAFSWCAFLA